jgi:competence protein ComEC
MKLNHTTTFKTSNDLLLWIPVFFASGVIFYLNFSLGFKAQALSFLTLLTTAIALSSYHKNNGQFLAFLASVFFILGSFYTLIFTQFSNQNQANGKIYATATGKVESIRKFYNPVNKVEGINLIITNPELSQAQNKKTKSPQKPTAQTSQSKPKKNQSPAKDYPKSVIKNFLNVENYQEIDREFLDIKGHYQPIFEAKNLSKISITLNHDFQEIGVNDVIKVPVLLQPPQKKRFPDDFDLELHAKYQKISAYGFGVGKPEILAKSTISNSEEYFAFLREKITKRISAAFTDQNRAGVAMALLIGNNQQISKATWENIGKSGLTHLLSISGFHLSLMTGIFFTLFSFILSRSEYLTLHFEIRKISTVLAVLFAYFYLKISGSSVPAQRAFLMILLISLTFFFNEKPNEKRITMLIAFLLILLNPYLVFNTSFQLTIASILVLITFHQDFWRKKISDKTPSSISKLFNYFLEIILLSIAVQIALLPFLLYSFQGASVLGVFANIFAIPLTGFFIMPLGIFSLFLMPLNLEKWSFQMMELGIFLLEKIINFTANLDYSYFSLAKFSASALIIAVIGLLLICLNSNKIRLAGVALFLLSFSLNAANPKPDILLDGEQKFFVIYDDKIGLVFSKKIRSKKQIETRLRIAGENEFKTFDDFPKNWQSENGIECDKTKCLIEKQKKKIMILLTRSKTAEICQNNFDAIVNLTRKYELPDCISKDKIKIDNLDFYRDGGKFIYLKPGRILVK